MKKSILARGFIGSVASLLGVLAVGCGADTGWEGAAGEGEIGSAEQEIRIAGLSSSSYDALFPASIAFDSNTVFVVGGLDSTGAGILTAKTYNKNTNTWTAKASLPANKQRGKAEMRVIPGTSDRYYLLAGGVDGNVELSDSLIYDKTNDTWTAVAGNGSTLSANMNSVRFGFTLSPCGTAGNSELIAIGGIDLEVGFNGAGSQSATNKVDVFTFNSVTPASSGWAPLKDNQGTPATLNLATARGYHETFEVSTTVFDIAGGVNAASNGLKSVERLTVSSSCDAAVRSARPDMTVSNVDYPRSKFASFLRSGKFIVAAGTSDVTDPASAALLTQALAYDPAANAGAGQWSLAGQITTGRIFPLSSSDPGSANTFAVVGGAIPHDDTLSGLITHELYNSVSDYDRYAGETGTTVWARPVTSAPSTIGMSVTRVGGWLAPLDSLLIYGHGMTALNGVNTFRQSPE